MLRLALRFLSVRLSRPPRSRARLDAAIARRLRRFERTTLQRAPHGRGRRWRALPIVDKADVLADFSAFTTRGVTLEAALAVAREAERSRDFALTLPGDIAVGLSSGTSGRSGVFLVSRAERERWAGEILARVLPGSLVRRILVPWSPPVRIAFLLRADSRLYRSVASRRVRFVFHDLTEPLERHMRALTDQQPDVLVAPATVLALLADAQRAGRMAIRPCCIVSVAEVLEPADADRIIAAFGVRAREVYQATEGLIGVSCAAGTVHVREPRMVVEREPIEGGDVRRFTPILTDTERATQLVVRQRLDDVLVERATPCPCGDARLGLEAIGGRADETLLLDGASGTVAVPPDAVRRAFALERELMGDWAIEHDDAGLSVRLRAPGPGAEPAVRSLLERLAEQAGAPCPPVAFAAWEQPAPAMKLRRIRERRRPGTAQTGPATASAGRAAVTTAQPAKGEQP